MRFPRLLLPTVLVAALVPAAPAAAAAPALGGKAMRAKPGNVAAGTVVTIRARARARTAISRLRVFVARRSGARSLRVGLYASRRGKPGRRLAKGRVAHVRRGQFNTARIRRVSLQAGRHYWIAALPRRGSLRSRRPAARCVARARRAGSLPRRWRGGRRAACRMTAFAPGATPAGPGGAVPGIALRPPARAVVDEAIAAPFIRHGRRFSGGADTNEGWGGGAPVILAVASYAGDTSADARLLAQMRDTIAGGNEPVADGGYAAQHERWVTGMYAIARHTPRIWNALTAAERQRIDLVMRGALVASAFTTSDSNPYVLADSQQYSLDGDDNLNRDWNPNYREGMAGMLLVGASYFGSGAAAHAVLDGYQPASFLAQLRAAGLTNMAETFGWKADHPGSNAPAPAAVAAAVRNFRYHGLALTQPMDILWRLTGDTYGARVACGLNGGAGIGGAGVIVSGCAGLPNKGALGMLREFDSGDAGGARSSGLYSHDGYRVNLVNHVAVLVGGMWQPGALASSVVARMRVGVPDLWYKLDRGYRDYSKGGPMSIPDGADGGTVFRSDNPNFGFSYSRSLWRDVIAPYHGL
jgi:hypothetical protein